MKKFLVLLLLVLIIPYITACESGNGEDPVEMVVLDLSITGEGEVDGLTEGENEVEQGTAVELEAEPAEGWIFSEWIGDVQEADSPETSINMNENKDLEVVFEGNIDVQYTAGPSETYHGLYTNYFFDAHNLTDEEISEVFKLYFNDRKVDEQSITLESGETEEIAFYNHSSDFIEDEDVPGTYPVELKRDGQVVFEINLEIDVKEGGAYYRFAGPREPLYTEWGEDDDYGEYYMVYHQIANIGDEKEAGGRRIFWVEDEVGEKVDMSWDEESQYVVEAEPLELEPGEVFDEGTFAAWPEGWELESGEYTIFIEIEETEEKISSTFTWE